MYIVRRQERDFCYIITHYVDKLAFLKIYMINETESECRARQFNDKPPQSQVNGDDLGHLSINFAQN